MTRKVVTCTRAETMSSIMELMTAGKFRHLPVVEGNKLIGIISIGDVVKYRVQQIEFEVRGIARLHPYRLERVVAAAAATHDLAPRQVTTTAERASCSRRPRYPRRA